MSAASTAAVEPLDSASLQAILIRWKLAEQFLLEENDPAGTGKMALHVLVSRDLPTLLRELVRVRTDLSLRPERTSQISSP